MTQSTNGLTSRETLRRDNRLYEDYQAKEGIIDELVDHAGKIRPDWQPFIASLSAMTDAEIANAWSAADRLVRDDGVTYNVHGDPNGEDRPWRLDPIPLLIAPGEWQALERGLVQRARLLNGILADLYGEQRLLTDGLIPVPLVFNNGQFLRPVHGVDVPDGTFLHFLAVDLARGPDGRWWVLSDRTQAPVGAGYALENRAIMARTLPDLFHESRVQSLTTFFQAFRDHLIGMIGNDDPAIVIHSPGPASETYFEHAYLARNLGIPLVEAADLTVRDRRVFLKTLTGLQPVHMIWRRVEAEGYDPLELQSGSVDGIPGIVEALRAGNITIINALGSGLVECEALMNFLPGLCQRFLGEDLLLPQTATWWCGQEEGRRFVLDNLSKLVIRPTFASRSIMQNVPKQIIGAELGATERQALAERIERQGEEFIAQDLITLSTAPSWQEGRLAPRPIALRVYIAASGDGYRVMPGGLTRTSEHNDPHAVFMRQGDASKDSWVLADGRQNGFVRPLPSEQPQEPKRGGQNIPSRAADNLFWLGRYAERAEGGARLVRSLVSLTTADAGNDDPVVREALLNLMIDHGHLSETVAEHFADPTTEAVARSLHMLILDSGAGNSLGAMLANLRQTAISVRERMSIDAWRLFQDLHRNAETYRLRGNRGANACLHFLNQVLRMLAAFSGVQMESMTRSFGWRLLDMGRRLERARLLAKLTAGLADRCGDSEEAALDLALQLSHSAMTYRTRYLAEPRALLVIDLLVNDASNPRSITFQLDRLNDHFAALPRDAESEGLSDEQQLLMRLRAKIDLGDLQELAVPSGRQRERKALSALMAEVETDLAAISDAVSNRYFSHTEPLGKSGPIWLGTPL